MRLFLALDLLPATVEALHLAIAPLRAAAPHVAWVPAGKLHLTLKFLGDGDEARLAELVKAASGLAAAHRAFEMCLQELGAFPNFRRPRVVWLGVEREPRLELLHHDLEVVCAGLGYAMEGRPFRPHITLARVRDPLPADRARALARAARAIAFSATEPVDRITLYDSVTGDAGTPYRRLHVATLGGP